MYSIPPVECVLNPDEVVIQRRYDGFASLPTASPGRRRGWDSNPQTPAYEACTSHQQSGCFQIK